VDKPPKMKKAMHGGIEKEVYIVGSFYREVGQLTFSVHSSNSANQISSDDTSDTYIMLQCRRSTVP